MKKRELLAMIQALEARVVALESTTPNRLRYITTGDPWPPMPPVTCGDFGPQTTASAADTVRIPPETIAKANTNGVPVLDKIGKPIGSATLTRDGDGFLATVQFNDDAHKHVFGQTHEKGTGYPILDDESKRIAEAVANTPHSC